MVYLVHDSGESGTLHNQTVLGDDSPLHFDDDGRVKVADPDVARKLAIMDAHVSVVDTPSDVALPFDPADLTVDELRDRLADGGFSDAELDALADAEREGKARETALAAIDGGRE